MIWSDVQTTLGACVSFSGVGVHSGEESFLEVTPAPINTGIVFITQGQHIPAQLDHVSSTTYQTILMKNNVPIKTTEHLLSALSALGIANAYCHLLKGNELPILDGSAWSFYFGLLSCGVVQQEASWKVAVVVAPVSLEKGDSFAHLTPSHEPVIEVSLDYDHPAFPAHTTHWSYRAFQNNFAHEVARARTYGFFKDLPIYEALGLAKGSSLDNTVVFSSEGVLNSLGMRFVNEPIRHKVLDTIGDLSLVPTGRLIGCYRGHRAGHGLTIQVLKKAMDEQAIVIKDICSMKKSQVSYG